MRWTKYAKALFTFIMLVSITFTFAWITHVSPSVSLFEFVSGLFSIIALILSFVVPIIILDS
jgi:hypothetical protein